LATIRMIAHPPVMDPTPGEPVHVQVVASAPMLRVGLERATLAAGLQLANPEAPTAIGLHSADTLPTRATVDLSVGANVVTIALTAVPDRETWMAVWELLGELFDAAAKSP
jgi:hypothetical protein